jgi:methionine-rich copper-binding protein CopC
MVLFIFMGSASAASTTKKVSVNDKNFVNVAIPFTQNNGLIADKNVKYSATTYIGTVYVENNGIVYKLSKDKKSWIVSEKFSGANKVAVSGLGNSKTKVNICKGNDPKNWKKNIPTYQQVIYTNLYKGVNLKLKAHGKNIEKIYVISRNGSPNSIWVNVSGSTGLKVNKNGELEILNGSSALKLTKPFAYQMINGKRVVIPVSYVLKGTSYGYKTGAYNKNYKLIIDPILSSTYLGGNSYDGINAITVDKAGNVYVTGYTGSNDFPNVSNPTQYNAGKNTNEWDVFVSKFNSNLSSLLVSTYIGGSLSDQANGIALDNSGNVFITGITYSTGNYTHNDFPVGTGGVNMTWDTGNGDVFVSKLDNNLAFIKSAIIGGNRTDVANGILVDASNNVYITGQTFSFNGIDPDQVLSTGYPVRYSAFGEPHMTHNYVGNGDIFVTKLNNNISTITSGVVFGGAGTSYANAIATDQQNYIYITGATNATDFPAIELSNTYPNNGLLTNKGGYDAFVVKLSCQSLENIESVALLGGSAKDMGNGIAVDPVGRVYVVGGTWSRDFQPIVSQQSSSNRGQEDAFVTILDKQLQSVLYSIYLGGNSNDVANGVVFSGLGPNFGVVGTTNSTNFAGVTSSPAYNGNEDVFFSVIKNPNTDQQSLDTSVIGGANADYGNCAAMTSTGKVYVAGNTWSNDYPTTIGAYSNFAHNDQGYTKDAYVTAIDNFVDNEPPVVTKSDPANNAVNVPLNKVINLVFNEPIKQGGNFTNITLSTINGPIIATATITGNSIVIIPNNYFKGTTYTINLPNDAVEDLAGNAVSAYSSQFTTIPPAQVRSTDPANNAGNVALNKAIKVVYSESIKAGANFTGITLSSISGPVGINSMTISGNTLTIVPLINYIGGTTYNLYLPTGAIEDLTGSSAAAYTTSFTTVPPLQVTSSDPANYAVSVPVNKVIKITFNKQIYSGSNFSQITLKDSSNTVIPVATSIIGNVLTIVKSSGTFTGGAYTLTIPVNSVVDVNNTSVLSSYTTTFTVDSTKPKVTSITPAKNAVKVATNKAIVVNFSKPIKIGPGAISIKSSSGKVIPITAYTITNGGKTLTLKHSKLFAKGTKYTIYFSNGSITDMANNYLAAYSSSFTTTK